MIWERLFPTACSQKKENVITSEFCKVQDFILCPCGLLFEKQPISGQYYRRTAAASHDEIIKLGVTFNGLVEQP